MSPIKITDSRQFQSDLRLCESSVSLWLLDPPLIHLCCLSVLFLSSRHNDLAVSFEGILIRHQSCSVLLQYNFCCFFVNHFYSTVTHTAATSTNTVSTTSESTDTFTYSTADTFVTKESTLFSPTATLQHPTNCLQHNTNYSTGL